MPGVFIDSPRPDGPADAWEVPVEAAACDESPAACPAGEANVLPQAEIREAIGLLDELTADLVLNGPQSLDDAERATLAALRQLLPNEAAAAQVELAVARGVTEGALRAKPRSGPQGSPAVPEEVRRAVVSRLWAASREPLRRRAELSLHRWRQVARVGWVTAAAAVVLAVGFGSELRRMTRQTLDIGPLIADGPVEPADGNVASYRIAREVGALKVWLSPMEEVADAQAAGANVVWSDVRQGGIAQVLNLPVNDPAVEQYQFWVVDADRPAGADRVPAGVFNVQERLTRDDRLRTLSLRPAVQVGRAVAFAVTLEPAGGSVLSEWPARLVLYADAADAERPDVEALTVASADGPVAVVESGLIDTDCPLE